MSEREDSGFGFAVAMQRDRWQPLVCDMRRNAIVRMVAAGEK
jgi:hypothetical protein